MDNIAHKLTDLADRLSNRLIWRLAPKTRLVPPGRRIVSFTFDDVPDTALEHGAAILEGHGARGTFYIAGGLEGLVEPKRRLIDRKGCAELYARGHEVASHTFAHRHLRSLGGALGRDLDANDRYLAQAGIDDKPRNFAFPYNAGWFPARRELARRFVTARGAGEAVNRGHVDPLMLKAVEIRQPEDHAAALTRWIDDLAPDPGWLIFFTHDVSDDPTPYGCRPQTLERLVAHARAAGCEILTVKAAARSFGWDSVSS